MNFETDNKGSKTDTASYKIRQIDIKPDKDPDDMYNLDDIPLVIR